MEIRFSINIKKRDAQASFFNFKVTKKERIKQFNKVKVLSDGLLIPKQCNNIVKCIEIERKNLHHDGDK